MFDQFQVADCSVSYALQGSYRGISTVTKQWVYGYLTANLSLTPQLYFISSGYAHDSLYAIYPQTIGIFTGKYDKNNAKIYVGDKIQWDAREEPDAYDVVEWYPRGACYIGVNSYSGDSILHQSETSVIVGTIFDDILEYL